MRVDRSKSVSGFSEVLVVIVDRVLNKVKLEPEQAQDASLLREHLESYMYRHGGPHSDKNPPDEQVLAQCLEVASVNVLIEFLMNFRKASLNCGQSYMWFVTVFLHRIHRASKHLTDARRALLKAKLQEQHSQQSEFPNEFLGDVSRLGRKIA